MADKFRRPFDPKGSDYDYDTARLHNLDPVPVPNDDKPHYPSRVPETGMLLKGRNHPTFDMGVEEDRKKGYGLQMLNGRYYTKEFKYGGYAQGKVTTNRGRK